MEDFISVIKSSILRFELKDVIDILIVAVLIYGLLKITSKTRASSVLKGLGLFLLLALICDLIGLVTVSWLMDSLISVGALLIVILFQNEIRRALEKIGRGRLFDINFTDTHSDEAEVIAEMQRAILNMSIRKIGALIVFERKTGLRDVIESGTLLEANISSQLVENIFFPNSPMHDGAMIIKDSKVVAAGCFLPLSDNKQISAELGTRHRAALGISELTDCYVIIVSEETGVISLAREGVLTRYIDRQMLKTYLEEIFVGRDRGARHAIGDKLKKWGAKG